MKRNYLVAGLVGLCMSCALWSCEELPVGGGTGTGGNDTIPSVNDTTQVEEPKDTTMLPSYELLSPLEAKQKMESVALKFVDAIEADAHQNVVDVMEYFVGTYGDFDLDEAYIEKVEVMINDGDGEDEDYERIARRMNPVLALARMTNSCLEAAQNGAQLASRVGEVYVDTWSCMLNLPTTYGRFTPDSEKEMWVYDASVNDRVELAFIDDNNQQWVATVKGSEETTRIHITSYDELEDGGSIHVGGPLDGTTDDSYKGDKSIYSADCTIDVPETLEFTVTCDGEAIIALNVVSSLAFDFDSEREGVVTMVLMCEYWGEDGYTYNGSYDFEGTYTFDIDYSNLNLAATLQVNNYEESLSAEATKTGTTMSTELKIDGRSLLKASGLVNADVDAIIADAKNEEFKARNIEDIKMCADILGELQVVVECESFKNLYDAFSLYDESQDASDENLFYNRVKDLNSAYSINVSYDGNGATQAIIELEGYEEVDEWNDDTYYNVRPVIKFLADESTYAIEDYFTSTAFSDLIESLEQLADEFDDLYGEYFEEELEQDVDNSGYEEDYHK